MDIVKRQTSSVHHYAQQPKSKRFEARVIKFEKLYDVTITFNPKDQWSRSDT